MPGTGIEIIGMISTTLASELYGRSIIAGAVDPEFIARFARAHEDGGFDRVLVGYCSSGADGFVVAAHARRAPSGSAFSSPTARASSRRRSPRARRPRSTTSPAAASRSTSSPAAATPSSSATATSSTTTRATAAPTSTSTSCARIWTSDAPVRLRRRVLPVARRVLRREAAAAAARSRSTSAAPPAPALAVGAQARDVYALWGEPVAAVARAIAEVRAAAAPPGRDAALQRLVAADPRRDRGRRPGRGRATSSSASSSCRGGGRRRRARPQSVGSQRLLDLAARGEVHDKRLWTRDRRGDRRARQHHRAGRHAGAGRRIAARLLRRRRRRTS